MKRENGIVAAYRPKVVLLQRQHQRVFHQVAGQLDPLRLESLPLKIRDIRFCTAEDDVREHVRDSTVDLLRVVSLR